MPERNYGAGGVLATLLGLLACSGVGAPKPTEVSAAGGSAGTGNVGGSANPAAGAGGVVPGFSGNGGAAASSGGGGANLGGGGGANLGGGGGTNLGGGGTSLGGSAGASLGGGAGTSPGGAGAGAGQAGAGACPGLFCEDFEHGNLDPLVWDTQTSGGQTVSVQSLVVAHGKYAAQFHAKPNLVSYDFIITKNAPAALKGHHFGRAYFNVTPKPPAQHTEFLFAGSAGFPKLKYLEVAGIGTTWQLTYVDQINGGESYASGGNAPDGHFICLEWEFNDAPDSIAVFVDSAPSYARTSIDFNGVSTGLVGGFTDFGFGYYAWHPASYAFDIYYDDIVLDTKRVGCLGGA